MSKIGAMGSTGREHTNREYEQELRRLREQILLMGAKVEELIQELSENYTIAIVTHNMQQAARVSDKTAFMYLGELIEFDDTSKIFTSPSDRRTQDYITGRFG